MLMLYFVASLVHVFYKVCTCPIAHVARGLCMTVFMWKRCKRHAVRQRPSYLTLNYAGFCAICTRQRQNHAWVIWRIWEQKFLTLF